MQHHADAVVAENGGATAEAAPAMVAEAAAGSNISNNNNNNNNNNDGHTVPAASPPVITEQRYIRLPDALYDLRRRYPTVTESIFLECTRCHQWVAVPVLQHVPDEVAEAAVAASAQGLDRVDERCGPRGPLRHVKQDKLHRQEEYKFEASAPQWRSQRLLEKEGQHAGAGSPPGATRSSPHNETGAVDGNSQSVFEKILRDLQRDRRRSTPAAGQTSTASLSQRRHPLLFIPNPDTFVCGGWQCAWDGDALVDLRTYWLNTLYKAMPMPAVSEDALSSSSSSSHNPSQSSLPASPVPLTVKEARQQRRAALNEALAEELHVNWPRRPGRSFIGRLARAGDQDSNDGLPPLSLPTMPNASTDESGETVSSSPSSSSLATTETDVQLSRLQQSWVKAAAMHLLRNGAGEGGGGAVDEDTAYRARLPHSPTTAAGSSAPSSSLLATEEGSNGAVLSAYCWAVCDACGKLRRVAQPFPGGAPFVCAMAVTTSSSCRATRDTHAGTAGGSSNSSSSSSSSNGAAVLNACEVSEVEGLLQCGVRLCEAELIAAALSSPFLPYPLKAQLSSLSADGGRNGAQSEGVRDGLSRADVTRVLLTEPLLRTIHTSVTEAIVEGTRSPMASSRRTPTPKARRTAATTPAAAKGGSSSGSTSAGKGDSTAEEEEEEREDEVGGTADAFLQRCLPILRELARTIKKRGTASLIRQVQLTPAQIQAKREAVLRNALLHDYPTAPPTVAAALPQAKKEKESGTKLETDAEPERERTKRKRKKVEVARPVEVQNNSTTAHEERTASNDRLHARSAAVVAEPKGEGSHLSVTVTSSHTTPSHAAKAAHVAHVLEQTAVVPAAKNAPAGAEPTLEKRKRGRPRKVVPDQAAAAAPAKIEATVAKAKDQQTEAIQEKKQDAVAPVENTPVLRKRARAETPPKPASNRGRGRPPGRSAATPKAMPTERRDAKDASAMEAVDIDEEDEEDEDDAWEVVHWVQCDRCSKWRVVPQHVPPTIEFWECGMRYDAERGRPTTCDDPDDADLAP